MTAYIHGVVTDVVLAIVVISAVAIYGLYLWWLHAHEKVEDEEFMRVKRVWGVRVHSEHPSSLCPICAEHMDLQKTQKVMFINNMPEVCCVRHTAREMTDYIKSHDRSLKYEKL
jgi:hypothetical protein